MQKRKDRNEPLWFCLCAVTFSQLGKQEGPIGSCCWNFFFRQNFRFFSIVFTIEHRGDSFWEEAVFLSEHIFLCCGLCSIAAMVKYGCRQRDAFDKLNKNIIREANGQHILHKYCTAHTMVIVLYPLELHTICYQNKHIIIHNNAQHHIYDALYLNICMIQPFTYFVLFFHIHKRSAFNTEMLKKIPRGRNQPFRDINYVNKCCVSLAVPICTVQSPSMPYRPAVIVILRSTL